MSRRPYALASALHGNFTSWKSPVLEAVDDSAAFLPVSPYQLHTANVTHMFRSLKHLVRTESRHLSGGKLDEAWQLTFADLGGLGAFAGQVVCVGDPGQIEPVVTGQTDRWRDSATGPHQPAPDALIAAHPDAVSVVQLRHTWRLGPDTTAVVQPVFYPDLPFESRRPDEYLTGRLGERLPEIMAHSVPVTAGPCDAALVGACADMARDLLGQTLFTEHGSRDVGPADLAVVTSHVGQAAAVQALLADLPGVLIGTANQLQGLERAAVVALHPLAGYREASGFASNPGRACVMLSRHRAHLALVYDEATPTMLTGRDLDPAQTMHRRLLDALTCP